jgi:hypothetical protein
MIRKPNVSHSVPARPLERGLRDEGLAVHVAAEGELAVLETVGDAVAPEAATGSASTIARGRRGARRRARARGSELSPAIPGQLRSDSRGGDAPAREQVSAATLHANRAASVTADMSPSSSVPSSRIRQ